MTAAWNAADATAVLDVVEKFERAWKQGTVPAIERHLPVVDVLRVPALVRLVQIDLKCRLGNGESCRVEHYLQRFPELSGDPDVLLDLLAVEYRGRRRAETAGIRTEYGERFPHLRERLLERLEGVEADSGIGGMDTAAAAAAQKAGPVAESVRRFVEVLQEHQMLGPAELDQVRDQLQSRHADAQSLAQELLRRGWLTRFQLGFLVQKRPDALVFGSYVILDELGKGAMGTVYKARHQVMKRLVALKLIRKGHLPHGQAVQRLQREIEAAAQLSHPNIVHSYDAGRVGDRHFFAMEYVEGETLALVLQREGRLPIGLACEYAFQTALGLQHAHEKGMVHRDIKPSNLLVASGGKGTAGADAGGPRIKILDMGLALIHYDPAGRGAKALTQMGQLMGTPDYIPPEQILNSHRVDTRADLYSLGCTLYQMLSGRTPFAGETFHQMLSSHLQKEPERLEGLVPGIPPPLAALVHRLLAKKPEERPQTPREAATALAAFRGGPAPVPRKPSPRGAEVGNQTQKETVLMSQPYASPPGSPITPRRRRGALILSLAAAFILGGGLLWWLFRGKGEAEVPKVHIDVDNLPKKAGPQPLEIGPSLRPKFDPRFLNALDPKNIPPLERFPWQPKGLVAVFGQHRVHGNLTAISPDASLIAGSYPEYFAGLVGVHIGSGTDLRLRKWLPIRFNPTALAFSSDNRTLAIGAKEKAAIRFWDLEKLEEKGVVEGLDAPPRFLAFLEGGRILAGTETTLDVLECATGKPIHRMATGPLLAVAASPDGKRALTGGVEDKHLRLWDLEQGKLVSGWSLPPTPQGKEPVRINAVEFSRDGVKAAVAFSDRTIKVGDPANLGNGKGNRILKNRIWAATDLDFSADGTLLLATNPQVNEVFDLTKDGSFPMITTPGSYMTITGSFSGDGKRILGAGIQTKQFATATGMELFPQTGLVQGAQCLALSADGRRLAAGGQIPARACVWDLAEGTETTFSEFQHIQSVAFGSEGSRFLLSIYGGVVPHIYDLKSSKKHLLERSPDHPITGIRSILTTPDDRHVLVLSENGILIVWEWPSALPKRVLDLGVRNCRNLDISHDGKRLLVDGILLDLASLEVIHRFPQGRFLKDGRILVPSGKAVVLFAEKGGKVEEVQTFPIPVPITGRINASADGKRIAAGLKVFDLPSGKVVWEWVPDAPFLVLDTKLSPDGRHLFTANGNGTVYVIRLPEG